jgi:CBS domain-containing protein
LRDDRFRELYVTDGKKNLVGYIDITDGLRVTATKSNVTVDGFVKDAPTVQPGDAIETVARKMLEFRTDSVAVTSPHGQLLGGILLSDLFPVIISRRELHGTVGSLMSGKVVTANPEDTVERIYSLIVESGFTAFPVVKKKKIVGLISRRDLISRHRLRSALVQHAKVPIECIMAKQVVTISSDDHISVAAEQMVKHDVSRLPVIDEGRLVGIVDRHDVLSGMSQTVAE